MPIHHDSTARPTGHTLTGALSSERRELDQTRPTSTGRLRRFIGALAVGVTLSGGLFAAGADVALAANSGSAICANQDPVVGVWVNVSGGTSGWASRSGSGYRQNWSYNTQGKPYSLTVGCGGTTSSWKASTSTPTYRTTWSNVMCFPGWGYGFGTAWVKDRCYPA